MATHHRISPFRYKWKHTRAERRRQPRTTETWHRSIVLNDTRLETRQKRTTFIAPDQMSTFSQFFLFVVFAVPLTLDLSASARAHGLAVRPIVLVFHSIYFAPSKIIYIFLGARCVLSCLASALSWWHRCGETAESRAHPRHTHTWRATNNTFYNNFIIRFPFICLVRSADAAGDAPASVCRCCLPAALIFIGLISP